MDKQIVKTQLREVLKKYDGDAKNPAVMKVINQLADFQSSKYKEKLLDGNWLLISAPSFPQGEKLADGKFSYTLGRLAFNMFKPTGLKLVIDQVYQPVFPINHTEQRTHDIVVEFTTIDNNYPQVKGIVRNLGVCESGENNNIKVKFTGGTLEPQENTDIRIWQEIFSNQKIVEKQSLKDKLSFLFLKFMFGLVPNQGMDRETGKIFFEMKRSPQGSLEILYLDEELRITWGEKGTILVCERK